MPTKVYRALNRPINRPITGIRGDTLVSGVMRHWNPDKLSRRDLTGCLIVCLAILADGTALDLTSCLLRDDLGGQYRLIIPPNISNGLTPWPTGLGSYRITLTDTLGVVGTYWAGPLGLQEVGHA